jgi:hypothetical protein
MIECEMRTGYTEDLCGSQILPLTLSFDHSLKLTVNPAYKLPGHS